MISDRVHKTLKEKSIKHQSDLRRLGRVAEVAPLSENVIELPQTNQVMGITTLLLSPLISREEFVRFIDVEGKTLPDMGTGPGHHGDDEYEYEIHHWEKYVVLFGYAGAHSGG